jgi:hypothetical protein
MSAGIVAANASEVSVSAISKASDIAIENFLFIWKTPPGKL